MYVCVSVCLWVSVGLCVCLKAMRFDIRELIATKLHTHPKDFPGNVLKPMSISWTYRKGLIRRAAVCSCHGFLHDCQALPFGQAQTFYTTASANTKIHSSTTLSSCGTSTGSSRRFRMTCSH